MLERAGHAKLFAVIIEVVATFAMKLHVIKVCYIDKKFCRTEMCQAQLAN